MIAPPIFRLREGGSKLLLSVPHAGTYIPETIRARLTPVGQSVVDTDWHVDQLYAFLADMDATTLVATHSRTVADLNRSSKGGLLYPGQAETGLCPLETFAGEPLYSAAPPDVAETAQRVEMYWQPYHNAFAPCTAPFTCWTVIPFAAKSPACSKAACRTSILVRIAAHPARRRSRPRPCAAWSRAASATY
jgi:hypothetical protein